MASDERDHFDNKGDKTGRSAKEKGFGGDERTQHYDEAGERVGKSREEEGLFGEKFTQHYDEAGEKTGRSTDEKGLFGERYTQHYDSRGEKAGTARAEKGLFGDEFVQHYDATGEKTGRTRVNQEARRREEREQRSREQLEQATRAYHADGALKLKNLKNVAWGPTLKLSFWRGMASGAVLTLIVPFLAYGGSLPERLLMAPVIGLAWGLTAWYGAPLNYILWRAIGAVLGPLTLGIGYLIANFALLVLAGTMSLGDPIIAYINRRSPHIFQVGDYPLFSLKSMIFIIKSKELNRERQDALDHDVHTAPAARDFSSQARSVSQPEPALPAPPLASRDAGATPEPAAPVHMDYAAEASEPAHARPRPSVLIFGVLLAAATVAALFVFAPNFETSPADQADAFQVLPYASQVVLVAKDDDLHFRQTPFARPDIAILRDSVAGEVLAVTGVVNQPEGAWYQVRLQDGRTAYFKATLVMTQSDFAAAQVSTLAANVPPQTLNSTDGAFGAFAISDSTLDWAVSYGFFDRAAAEVAAVRACAERGAGDCRTANYFENACGALAIDSSSRRWAAHWGQNEQAARASALRACGTGNCAIARVACSGGAQ